MSDPDSEILLEITRAGSSLEVRAISSSDGLEVSFIAPANAPESDIESLARAKLAYVRGKGQRGAGDGKPPDGRGGLIV